VDDLLHEKEQMELIRAWFSQYGSWLAGGIIAGALILFGINYYQGEKLNTQLEASQLFETLANHVGNGDIDGAEATAAELAAYEDTAYAAQAKLAIARLYMDKNRDQDAADALAQVLSLPGAEELKDVARLRLAKIYLYQDKAQEIIDLLDGNQNAAYAARYSEALGDAYAALGQVTQAEAAYQAALGDELSASTIDRALVQWKILDLPKAVAAEDAAEPAAEDAAEAVSEPAAEDMAEPTMEDAADAAAETSE
jgi:predicted negative regulator of RcsB-dependent stress response